MKVDPDLLSKKLFQILIVGGIVFIIAAIIVVMMTL